MKPKLTISKLDWNEIVPLLAKDMRDSLYLEAAILLAADAAVEVKEEAPYSKNKTMRQRRNQYRKQNTKANGLEKRYWRTEHPNESLVLSGRRFKINKDIKRRVQIGSAQGRAWTQLKEMKNDTITTEGLYSIAKGNKIEGAQLISNLWTNHQIDVEPAPPANAE